MKIYKRLAADNPKDLNVQVSLGLAYHNMAAVQSGVGRATDALSNCGEALRIREHLANAYPHIVKYESNQGDTLNNLGDLYEGEGRLTEALEFYGKAVERLRHAFLRKPQDVGYRTNYDKALHNYARLQRRVGHQAETVEAARRCRDLWPKDARGLYNTTCEFALCANSAPKMAEKQALLEEAVEVFHAAVAAGWRDMGQTRRDHDLASLKDQKEFCRLVAEMLDQSFPSDPFARP